MGTYINPGNQAFKRINTPNYIDKTGLIELFNERIGGDESLVCVSRPRRFGKSYAAKMLTAYYDRSCDSHSLFDDKNIACSESYTEHLNKYNVIYLDITTFTSDLQTEGHSLRDIPKVIQDTLKNDLKESGFPVNTKDSLNKCLLRCVEASDGKPFIFIIDEWDAVIREAKDDTIAQKRYLNLLRSWFKNGSFTPKAVAAAYITGILPIKKDGSQSAISEFDEFSMLDPLEYAGYVGFTEEEVKSRCKKKAMNFKDIKSWYDGYYFTETGSVYNPYSVIKALKTGKCQSYWRATSVANPLIDYIRLDFDGLREKILRLMTGEHITVNVNGFQNDFESFEDSDDVLTLLIHLGYLTYSADYHTVQIPNEEIRGEFRQLLKQKKLGAGWIKLIKRSETLIKDVCAGNEEAVAATLEEIREEQYAPQFYNNEQSLRAIIKYAFISTYDQYCSIEEMPSGKGIADVAFIPAPYSPLPAMVVELKWNKTSGGAIEQIKKKKYTAALKSMKGNILLVGINYDEKTGKHTCMIEQG